MQKKLCTLCSAILCVSMQARAQGANPLIFSVAAGVGQIDAVGVHATPVLEMRVGRTIGASWSNFQFSLTALNPQQGGSVGATVFVIPEFSWDVQQAKGRIHPFASVGIGGYWTDGGHFQSGNGIAVSGGFGIRPRLSDRMNALFEARARGMGSSFGISTTSLVAGLGRKF